MSNIRSWPAGTKINRTGTRKVEIPDRHPHKVKYKEVVHPGEHTLPEGFSFVDGSAVSVGPELHGNLNLSEV